MIAKVQHCFFVPVAPKDFERSVWTTQSILRFCPDSRVYLILDNFSPDQLSPPPPYGDNVRIVVNRRPTGGHWGEVLRMQIAAMRDATAEHDVSDDAILYRIDSDGLVVRSGLTDRAQRLFSTRPLVGQIGQCFSGISGSRLSNQGWENYFRKTLGLRGLRLFLTNSCPNISYSFRQRVAAWLDYRKILRFARLNGYMWGEFGLGPYIIRSAVIRNLDKLGWIDNNPFRLMPKVGDDVGMTVLVYAAGFTSMDDTADGGIFGISGKEPEISPFLLRDRGHYILHSMKYGINKSIPKMTEKELIEALIR